jgi:RimJ/RimL family protein N-acetyltransferase
MDARLPKLRKCRRVVGHRLQFRDAQPSDAEFILALRLDEKKNQFLSSTRPELEEQVRWLEDYQQSDDQAYFVIEDRDCTPVGTVRLYDAQGDLFSWGSWILSDQAPPSSAVESTLIVYHYGLSLGFAGAYFDVRHGNERVWQYHERFGALRVREDEGNYHYEISRSAIERSLDHYRSRLPNGIRLEC